MFAAEHPLVAEPPLPPCGVCAAHRQSASTRVQPCTETFSENPVEERKSGRTFGSEACERTLQTREGRA
jgi:hypothetical protein